MQTNICMLAFQYGFAHVAEPLHFLLQLHWALVPSSISPRDYIEGQLHLST